MVKIIKTRAWDGKLPPDVAELLNKTRPSKQAIQELENDVEKLLGNLDKKKKRKIIYHNAIVDFSLLNDDINTVINNLRSMKKSLSHGHSMLSMKLTIEDCDGYLETEIQTSRYETRNEEKIRLREESEYAQARAQKNKELQQNKDKADRELFKKLLKKYGNESQFKFKTKQETE